MGADSRHNVCLSCIYKHSLSISRLFVVLFFVLCVIYLIGFIRKENKTDERNK